MKGRQKLPGIPTESDWGNYRADLDQKWAHDQYCGHSNEQMHQYIRNSPIEAFSDLQFMPEIPFRYYVLGYRDCVTSGHVGLHNSSDAASCLLHLVAIKLEREPRHIVPVMPELLPAVEYVAANQERFEADEEIYGSFATKLELIKRMYAECKDRYRRYP